MAKLFIGMPVYNGEKFIKSALLSLIQQDFKEWSLLISDNASTDATASICQEIVKTDSRIHYYRQSKTLDVAENFRYLLQQSTSPFFMWAASDDEWSPNFLSCGVSNLENNSKVGLSFSQLINIDSFGRTIRTYPDFTRFQFTQNKTADVFSYFLEPPILGKANLFYGIYRTEICKQIFEDVLSQKITWGTDLIFNLMTVMRANISISNQACFKKRIHSAEDTLLEPAKTIDIGDAYNHPVPIDYFTDYAELIKKLMGHSDMIRPIESALNLMNSVSKLHSDKELLEAQIRGLKNTNNELTETLTKYREKTNWIRRSKAFHYYKKWKNL